MTLITQKNLALLLEYMGVKKCNDKYCINNCEISFVEIDEESYAKISGKITLPLAEKIYNHRYRYPIFLGDDFTYIHSLLEHARNDTCKEAEIPINIKYEIPYDRLFITNILIGSTEGLQFVIEQLQR